MNTTIPISKSRLKYFVFRFFKIMKIEINYGFNYCSPLPDENSVTLFGSKRLEFIMYYVMSFLQIGSNPLLHGNKVF